MNWWLELSNWTHVAQVVVVLRQSRRAARSILARDILLIN